MLLQLKPTQVMFLQPVKAGDDALPAWPTQVVMFIQWLWQSLRSSHLSCLCSRIWMCLWVGRFHSLACAASGAGRVRVAGELISEPLSHVSYHQLE